MELLAWSALSHARPSDIARFIRSEVIRGVQVLSSPDKPWDKENRGTDRGQSKDPGGQQRRIEYRLHPSGLPTSILSNSLTDVNPNDR